MTTRILIDLLCVLPLAALCLAIYLLQTQDPTEGSGGVSTDKEEG